MIARGWVLLVAGMLAACTPRAPSRPPLSGQQRRDAEQRLSLLRASLPVLQARLERIAVQFQGPAGVGVTEARGAVMVAPPDALRMVLTGPLGATALDVWIRGDLWRVAVPSLGLVRRGKGTPRGHDQDLPIAFLRWWLLTPLEGALLDAPPVPPPYRDRFVLGTTGGEVTLDVASPSGPFAAAREGASGREEVTATAIPCGEASYRQAARGLRVMIRCEGMDPVATADARALDDPDEKGAAP